MVCIYTIHISGHRHVRIIVIVIEVFIQIDAHTLVDAHSPHHQALGPQK